MNLLNILLLALSTTAAAAVFDTKVATDWLAVAQMKLHPPPPRRNRLVLHLCRYEPRRRRNAGGCISRSSEKDCSQLTDLDRDDTDNRHCLYALYLSQTSRWNSVFKCNWWVKTVWNYHHGKFYTVFTDHLLCRIYGYSHELIHICSTTFLDHFLHSFYKNNYFRL